MVLRRPGPGGNAAARPRREDGASVGFVRRVRHASLAALALAALVPASAAAQWSDAQAVTPSGRNARSPDVAVNARGDAIAAWIISARSGRSVIRASIRPAGRAWGPARTLSRVGRSARDPRVAINDRGQVLAAWRRVARNRRVRVAGGRLRPQAVYVVQARRTNVRSASWDKTQTLSSARQKTGAPRVGLDARGSAVVTWHWGTGTAPGNPGFVSRVQAAVAPRGGRFRGAQRLSRLGGCAQAVGLPDVAMGEGGHAIAWWECRRNRRDIALDYATLSPGAARLGADRRLRGVARGELSVSATVASDGAAVMALTGMGGARAPLLLVTERPAGSGALARLPVPLNGQRVSAIAVAGTASGDSIAAWIGARTGSEALAPLGAASRAASALFFGPSEELQAPRRAEALGAALAASGSANVIWVQGVGRTQRVLTTTRPSVARPWGAPEAISSAGEIDIQGAPAIAVDADGDAIAVWSRRVDGRFRVERAEYRATRETAGVLPPPTRP